MPSQQNSRMSHDFSYDYLSAKAAGGGGGSSSNNSKVENYKRIKQEEAAARAQLMAPSSRDSIGSGQKAARNNIDLGALAAHRRNPSLLDRKYKPSENALKAYSPLRNGLGQQMSQQQLPQFVPSVLPENHVGVISSMELKGLRGII